MRRELRPTALQGASSTYTGTIFRLVARELRDRLRTHVWVLDHEFRWRMGDPVGQGTSCIGFVEVKGGVRGRQARALAASEACDPALTGGSMSGDGTGGLLDIRSVVGYAYDVSEHRRRLVVDLDDLAAAPTRRNRPQDGGR